MTTPALAHLVERWVAGFAGSRQVPSVRRGEVLEVEVDGGGRRLELVLTEPSQPLLDEVAQRVVATSDVWVTVLTGEPWALLVPTGLRVELDHEVLMTRTLERRDVATASVDHLVEGQRLHAVVRDGELAVAGGWVAVVGEHATFDRIETHREHRRRGLGGVVMGALETWAIEQGARTGVLAASLEGQALYARLGWDVVARMTTLAGAERTIATP